MKEASKFFGIGLALGLFVLTGCGGGASSTDGAASGKEAGPPGSSEVDPMDNIGIGPVKSVELGEIDQAMAAEGEKTFNAMCTACHKAEEKYIGPAPKGIMSRRNPAWIMNMMLNPDEMVQKDPIAKKLLQEANLAPMANQNLTEEQARQILEYFRTLN
ncbi:MAG: cytochrome c [Cyclobacteriaceae bacterium]|nr:cytochrome c [Cyclobacteriaceae bacterium]